MDSAARDVAMLLLRAATQVNEDISRGVASRGFDDVRPAHGFAFVRPAHGFAFVRISAGDATVVDVAEHLGVTKQAASQLVEQLVQRGYLTRTPDPRDGRSQLLSLTARGLACRQAAEAAAAEAVTAWESALGRGGVTGLRNTLLRVVKPGPLRPTW
jgi:DNA-binding MarR family transcriptional regulator